MSHLVDYQISLVERAERSLDENKDAVKHLLDHLKSSIGIHPDPDAYIVDSTSTGPASYLFEMYRVCKRARYLCDQIQAKELYEHFYSKGQEFYLSIRSHMIGSKYFNCKNDEYFTIVDVYDLVPESDTVVWMAIQQYEDGIPWDQNAEAIAKRIDYQLVEFNLIESVQIYNTSVSMARMILKL